MKNNQFTQNIFRMSAILYANNNVDGFSPLQVHVKVIEDALLYHGEKISIPSLVSFIYDQYSLTIVDSDIERVVNNAKFTDRFVLDTTKDHLRICLSDKRRSFLESTKTETLSDYVEEFLRINKCDSQKSEVLYQYLYGIFATNLEGYKSLTKGDTIKVSEEDVSYSDEDKILINQFLDWDNAGKNRAVFNLASYSLEYCMLTNNKNTSIDAVSLRNKVLYLDTNILFRAIGFNGEDRKDRTLQFLATFKRVNQRLMISKETDLEFSSTLDYQIKQLKRSIGVGARVDPKVYVEYVPIDGIYKYYNRWKIAHRNSSIDIFENFIKASYKSLLDDYSIEKDFVIPFSEEEEIERIKDYSSAIHMASSEKFYAAAEHDARNILWIEKKRGASSDSLNSVKHFFISSDQYLRRWDYNRNSNHIPIVMLPSQWLSIVLRYLERTDNDYKSFVCFLNMKVNHSVLTEEQFYYAIEGISEMTSDLSTQRNLLQQFIESDLEKTAAGEENDDILEQAKSFAASELDERIAHLEKEVRKKTKKINKLSYRISEHSNQLQGVKAETAQLRKQYNKEVDGYREKISKTAIDSSEKDKRIAELESLIEAVNRRRDKFKKAILIILVSAGIIVLVLFLLACFFWQDSTYNPVASLVNYIDQLKSDTQKRVCYSLIILPISGIGLLIKVLSNLCKRISAE